MGFLTFLPFLLQAKGASIAQIELGLTLVFAGGAAGKLVCGYLGAWPGVLATVILTEGLTAAGIRTRFRPAAGYRHWPQRDLVRTLWNRA
jgi:hypothetical protein